MMGPLTRTHTIKVNCLEGLVHDPKAKTLAPSVTSLTIIHVATTSSIEYACEALRRVLCALQNTASLYHL